MGTALTGTANNWDAFYTRWVHLVAHFGAAVLVVFAVLMALAVVATPLLVDVGDPGPRSAGNGPALRDAYWLGVVCLLFATIEATIVFPLSHNAPWAQHASWVAGVSIGLITAAVIVGFTLLRIVGRPRPENRTALRWGIAGLCFIAAILIAGLFFKIGHSHWPSAWLSGKLSAAIYAVVLAALGVCIVARTRGIGIGLLVQGHDKTGADDAGLGAFVRARLYSLGSQEPKGIMVTQQTDTSTLPSGALGLIPAGNLAKLATLFMSLFTPPTPWRVDVTEQDDGSIVISIRRNGRVAEAVVIRPSTLELPSRHANGAPGGPDEGASTPAAGADASGSNPGGSGTGGDWTTELRTAAATFILVALSRRYYHLQAGLCGATDWRSVALQVIASDPASRLTAKDKHAVLVHAVADDRENKAAELAFLSDCYRTASSTDDLTAFATKLERLLRQLPEDNEGTLPLRLRGCFNLIVAYVNYATSMTGERSEDAALQSKAYDALMGAKKQTEYLLGFWSDKGNQDKYTALWQSMYASVNFAAKVITAELRRSGRDDGIRYLEASALPVGVKMTLLARYENACALTRGREKHGAAKAGEYDEALAELEVAVADPVMLMWARSDPSLAELHDVDQVKRACSGTGETAAQQAQTAAKAFGIVARFKELVGDQVPADFLSLSPFAAYRDALALRGIHDAARLQQTRGRELRSELSITRGEVARWREVTDLYQLVGACPSPDGNGATGAVFLLLEANLDSMAAVNDALASPAQLRHDLLDKAREWAVVAPGEEEIGTWGRHLGVPPH
jgi:hypothetical protein